jgi:HEAT repeat protein
VQVRSATLLPVLVELLGDERTRAVARVALLGFEEDGFASLEKALGDESLPGSVRNEIPRALALFDPQRVASLLLERFTQERDGMVRYRILRVLEGVVSRAPGLQIDRDTLRRAIGGTVTRAYLYLDQRRILEVGATAQPGRATPGHAFLVRMLMDKEKNAVSRLFRLLGLGFPTEDFAEIHRGLLSDKSIARASSIELIENLLEEPLRRAVIGLIDDVPDLDRLAAGEAFHKRLQVDYEALLRSLLGSESEALQDVAVFHVGELALTSLLEPVAALAARTGERRDVERTLRILGAPSAEAGQQTELSPC